MTAKDAAIKRAHYHGLEERISAGSVGKIDKNGRYAIDAYRILKSDSTRHWGKKELWNLIDRTASVLSNLADS